MAVSGCDEMVEIQKEVFSESSEMQEVYESAPPWRKQITTRGIVVSVVIGVVYSVIIMKFILTTGVVPSLNMSASLLAFVFIKTWTKLLQKFNFITTPFTRQENTVIQTCVVSCYAIAMGGGFGSYLLALSKRTYEQAGVDTEGNPPGSWKNPGLGWMTGFLFIVSFVGLLMLVPLRKIMIVDYKLPFPSGTASAILINGFHTKKGSRMAKKQIQGFVKFFSFSFVWSFFQWFYTGGQQCGFINFPTFGLKAWKQTFYFDFSMAYVGAGMICPHNVNLSMLLGGVLSWGIMWPLISAKKGDWYPQDIPETSMKSLTGYQIFIAIFLILGDGLYNFFKTLIFTLRNMHAALKKKHLRTDDYKDENLDNILRNEVFLRESIPFWVACVGYSLFCIISIIVIPVMFPQLKWYYVLVSYIVVPGLSFCNAYGTGLTNMSMAASYGKVALFVLAAMAGKENGVVAGLIGLSVIKSAISTSAELMHDLRTAYLTLTSPRSMLIGQAIGTAIGCIVGPLTFFLFYKSFDIGNPEDVYKAPYAIIFRNMAILGVEGFSALPQHCLELCFGFFAMGVIMNMVRDMIPVKFGRWIPIPMAMAVPFFLGAYFTIDMALGSLIVYLICNRMDRKEARMIVPAIGAGLICGDGLWTLPSFILTLAKINPPICMSFSSAVN